MKKSFQKCILQTRKKLMNHIWDEMFLQYFAISAKISQHSISKEFSNILISIYLHYEIQNSPTTDKNFQTQTEVLTAYPYKHQTNIT